MSNISEALTKNINKLHKEQDNIEKLVYASAILTVLSLGYDDEDGIIPVKFTRGSKYWAKTLEVDEKIMSNIIMIVLEKRFDLLDSSDATYGDMEKILTKIYDDYDIKTIL